MENLISGARALLIASPVLLLVLGGQLCDAAVYKYKDANGNWHFSDAPVDLPNESETMEGMIERSTELIDLRTQVMTAISPQNDIEKAVGATVAIKSTVGSGSGFFITPKGHILTNKHVLQYTDDQEQQADRIIGDAESKLRAAGERLEQEEKQLRNTKSELEKAKAYIDSQPDSQLKEVNRARYLSDLQSYLAWEESYLKRKKLLAERKKDLWDKKVDYKRDASVAALNQAFTVYLADNTELNAYLVRRSEKHDLALLKVDGYTTPFLEPARFRATANGDPVYAIGNPIKLRNSVASGTLSGYEGDFAKTDAKIYPGNSGGPLVTVEGRVIGVNTFKKITHKFEGLGFAITIERALAEFGDALR